MAVVLLARLQVHQILLAVLRFAPDAPVEDDHDGDGHVERGQRRAQRQRFARLEELDVAVV